MSEDQLSGRPASTPPIPEATLSYASADLGREVREIGMAQRKLLWAVLITIGALLIGSFALIPLASFPDKVRSLVLGVTWYGTAIFMMLRMYQLSVAMGYGLTRRVLYMVGTLMPWINLLVVLSATRDATRALERAGIRVGIMGAKLSDLP